MSTPKEECEALIDAILPFAKQTLARYGEFYPYGAAMDAEGRISAVARYDGDEFPKSTDVIRGLKDVFIMEAKNGKYKATALAYDVRITLPSSSEKSDAIAISLNHRDGYSIVVLFPYRMENGSAVIGTALAQRGEADIFL